MGKKRVLLKLTGKIFTSTDNGELTATLVNSLIAQIKMLAKTHQFGVVIGGGNFFRGNEHGRKLGLTPAIGHQIGMLATIMNGLILKDLFEQQNLGTSLFCAIPSPEVGIPISYQTINSALQKDHTLIFSGGTGNPFFTTDTNAILRALQIGAREVWKGTDVDGVYNKDPKKHNDAHLLPHLSYKEALRNKLGIMDPPAFALAQQHTLTIKIFDIFGDSPLLRVAKDINFGSTITNQG